MEQFFTDLIDWMTAVTPFWAYALILLIAYVENVVPPIPGDLIVVFGGYLVGLGKLTFWGVVLLATVGGVAGDAVLRWNGDDDGGRPLAAGTYLAVVRGAGLKPLTSRVVLTR